MSFTIPNATAGNLGTSLYEPYPALQTEGGGRPYAQYRNSISIGGVVAHGRGLFNVTTSHSAYKPRVSANWSTVPFTVSPMTLVPTNRQGPFGGIGLFYLTNGRLIHTYLDSPGPTWEDDVPRWMYQDGFGNHTGAANEGWITGGVWPIATPGVLCSGHARGQTWILYTLPVPYPTYNDCRGDLYIAFNTDMNGGGWESHLVQPRVLNAMGSCVWLGNEWLVIFADGIDFRTYQKRFSHVPCSTVPPVPTVINGRAGAPYYDFSLNNIARNSRGVLLAFPGTWTNRDYVYVSKDNGDTWTGHYIPKYVDLEDDMWPSVFHSAHSIGDAFIAVTTGFTPPGSVRPGYYVTHNAGNQNSPYVSTAWL